MYQTATTDGGGRGKGVCVKGGRRAGQGGRGGGEEEEEGDKDEEEEGLLLYNCSTVHFELCNTVL